MKRKQPTGTLADLPAWVLTYVAEEWPAIGPDAQTVEIRSHAAWRHAKRAWLARHAPHLTAAEVREEAQLRNPVVSRPPDLAP